jgi:SAM-dependent methyltransferase
MSFNVAADAYDAFMGRYSRLLATQMADFAFIAAGQRVLDVGCGPGALTTELVARLGSSGVVAVDPSEPFVEALTTRLPGVEVHRAPAEDLPFGDASFDAALAQLVVHFMADPVAGLREMARVTRGGGFVAACVWDHGGGRGPHRTFWRVARELDPTLADESKMPGVRRGDLMRLMGEAGLESLEETELSADLEHASFEDWWEPFEGGVGPAGAFVSSLDPARRAELRERARAETPDGPFVVVARAWAARGRVAAG